MGAPSFTKTYTGQAGETVTLTYTIVNGVATHDGLTLGGTITAISPNTTLTATPNGGVATVYNFAPLVRGHNQFSLTGDVYATLHGGSAATGSGTFTQSALPEPASIVLLGIGLSGLLAFRRLRGRLS